MSEIELDPLLVLEKVPTRLEDELCVLDKVVLVVLRLELRELEPDVILADVEAVDVLLVLLLMLVCELVDVTLPVELLALVVLVAL